MKDSDFRVYEQYALNGRKIEDARQKLVEDTVTFEYLKVMDLLSKRGNNLKHKEIVEIENLISKWPHGDSLKVRRRLLFIKYDNEKDPDMKRALLNDLIKNHLNLTFSYQKPSIMIGNDPNSPLNANLPKAENISKSYEECYNLDKILYKVNTEPHSINSYSPYILSKLDFEKLEPGALFSVTEKMGQEICIIKNDKFYKAWTNYCKREDTSYKSQMLPYKMMGNFTLKQLDKLADHISALKNEEEFWVQYLKKKFYKELFENVNATLLEKWNGLIKVYEFVNKNINGYELSNYQSGILARLLIIGVQMKKFDESLFIKYLSKPYSMHLMKDKTNVRSSSQIFNFPIFQEGEPLKSSSFNKKLFKAYLKNGCKGGEKMSKYESYIEYEFLNKTWQKILFTSNQKIEITKENTENFEKLAKKVSIKFDKSNKECFEPGESISLNLKLKNVPILQAKIFEIDIENYYKKNLKPFQTDINLDGLLASFEKIYEFKQPSQMIFDANLQFPELLNKQGLFVIELIGNGKSSRAVIKIGTLSLMQIQTPQGHECYILDGSRKICCDSTTGIWLNNMLYPADNTKNGKIIIPYLPDCSNNSLAILLHKGLAQLTEIKREVEKYQLQCNFFMLPESFILGGKATISMQPILRINNKLADLSLLSNVHCIINTETFTGDIPSSKSFTDLKPAENKEILVTFQVGANIKSMTVDLIADIQNNAKNVKETLKVTHKFNINSHLNDMANAELFLSLNKDGQYEIQVLGKNGEPIINSDIQLNFGCKGINSNIMQNCVSDSLGTVRVGFCKNVQQISAQATIPGVKGQIFKTWNLPNQCAVNMPELIDCIEGEIIELSIPLENFEEFYLKKIVDKAASEDYEHTAKIEKNMKYADIKISGLKQGNYVLFGPDLEKIIIRVHEGTYWSENNSYINKKFSLLEAQKIPPSLKAASIKIEQKSKENNSYLDFKVNTANNKNWRAHVMLFRYLPQDLAQITSKFLRREKIDSMQEFMYQKWSNFFLSNRELSTEFKYCLDRKNLPRFMGNTLPRPQLVLKREFSKETQSIHEVPNEGTKYVPKQEKMESAQRFDPNIFTTTQLKRNMILQSENGVEFLDCIPSFQNFLAKEPLVMFNLPANEEGLKK